MTIRRSSAFHVVRSGVLPRAGDDDDLFGARGSFPTLAFPTLSIPGVGDLTSVLGLPGPDTSTTSTTSTTSAPAETTSNTISLTSNSASSTTTATSSSATTTSNTTTSTTTPVPSTTSDTATSTSPPSTTLSSTSTQPPTVTVTSSGSASPAATSQADAAPKSFLQNKALSVGVITAATLVGLVLIIALATWVVRKRRNDRLNQDIIDFSNAGLVNEHDSEKGGVGGFGGNVETHSTGSGNGSSLGHGNTVPPPVQPRQMYQDMGYGAAAAYGAPSHQASRNQAARPYGAQGAYGGAYGAYQQPSNTYLPPSATYNTWNHGYPGAGAPQYDQAYGGMDDAYSGYIDSRSNMAGYGAGAQQTSAAPLQRRPSAQRKPAPQLDLTSEGSTSPRNIVASPESTPSLSSGAPPPPEKPYPKLPVPGPLPDEFGASLGSPTEHQEPRRLVVRND